MSEQRGLLVTCDRCGDSLILREGEYDEDGINLPCNWSRVQFSELYLTSPAFYDLCPYCTELFRKHHDEFFKVPPEEFCNIKLKDMPVFQGGLWAEK